MKKYLLLLAVLATAAIAQTAPAPVAPPAATTPADGKKVDVLNAPDGTYGNITNAIKERDEARAQIDILQKNAQQAAVVTEYYKVVAERNEALLRLTQANAQITVMQGEIDHMRAAATAKK